MGGIPVFLLMALWIFLIFDEPAKYLWGLLALTVIWTLVYPAGCAVFAWLCDKPSFRKNMEKHPLTRKIIEKPSLITEYIHWCLSAVVILEILTNNLLLSFIGGFLIVPVILIIKYQFPAHR